jgi:hypothetical protein
VIDLASGIEHLPMQVLGVEARLAPADRLGSAVVPRPRQFLVAEAVEQRDEVRAVPARRELRAVVAPQLAALVRRQQRHRVQHEPPDPVRRLPRQFDRERRGREVRDHVELREAQRGRDVAERVGIAAGIGRRQRVRAAAARQVDQEDLAADRERMRERDVRAATARGLRQVQHRRSARAAVATHVHLTLRALHVARRGVAGALGQRVRRAERRRVHGRMLAEQCAQPVAPRVPIRRQPFQRAARRQRRGQVVEVAVQHVVAARHEHRRRAQARHGRQRGVAHRGRVRAREVRARHQQVETVVVQVPVVGELQRQASRLFAAEPREEPVEVADLRPLRHEVAAVGARRERRHVRGDELLVRRAGRQAQAVEDRDGGAVGAVDDQLQRDLRTRVEAVDGAGRQAECIERDRKRRGEIRDLGPRAGRQRRRRAIAGRVERDRGELVAEPVEQRLVHRGRARRVVQQHDRRSQSRDPVVHLAERHVHVAAPDGGGRHLETTLSRDSVVN